LFGEYLAANGLGRLVIESWRVNPRVLLGLTEPQIVGVALIVGGAASWLYFKFRGASGDLQEADSTSRRRHRELEVAGEGTPTRGSDLERPRRDG
jgi:prolipoprotein diacylglyceryltransferase